MSTERAPQVMAPTSHPLRTTVVAALAAGITGSLAGIAYSLITTAPMQPWLMARASGITAYLLLTLVTMMGLLLSHPRRARWARPSSVARIRLHVVLTVLALAFTVFHFVVLALDPYAKVGWAGALLPMAAVYRPIPVTLGVLSLWTGLVVGLTAGLAGRGLGRIWLPLHRLSAVAWILAWVHGLLAGSDTTPLLILYIATGGSVVILALWRYVARTPSDEVDTLTRRSRARTEGP